MGVNITDFGAIGDGVADDRAAIQAAYDSLGGTGGTCFVPGTAANYKITAPLSLNANSGVIFEGEGQASKLWGNFDGFIIDRNTPTISDAGPHSIKRLHVRNNFTTGGAVRWRGVVNSSIEDCQIKAFRGIVADGNTFTLNIKNIRISPALGGVIPVGSIGIYSGGHTTIESVDVVGFDHGIRASGSTVDIKGGRFEVNRTGLMLGLDINGADYILRNSDISGNSFEADDVAIFTENIVACTISAFGISGTVGSPSSGSQYGLRVFRARRSIIEAGEIGGGFAQAGIKIDGGTLQNTVMQAVMSAPSSGAAWQLPADLSGITFIGCNQ